MKLNHARIGRFKRDIAVLLGLAAALLSVCILDSELVRRLSGRLPALSSGDADGEPNAATLQERNASSREHPEPGERAPRNPVPRASRDQAASAGPGARPSSKGELVEADAQFSVEVSPREQHFIYLLNRARFNPVAYQHESRLPVDFSSVAPKPPLAVSGRLCASAQFHAKEMARHDYVSHRSTVTGQWPNRMARNQGYQLPGFFDDEANYIESISAGTMTAATTLRILAVDAGTSPPLHRHHLLGIGDFQTKDREIGVGYARNPNGAYKHYWSIHITRRDEAHRFLTGVVFEDENKNTHYDPGEGLSRVRITAKPFTTHTNTAGGWSICVPPGEYEVAAHGSEFQGIALAEVTLTDESIEIDFISEFSRGVVNFDDAADDAR